MPYLIDTSILVRVADEDDELRQEALSALLELHRRGEVVNITPQVLIEFRSVATRPRDVNGLGLKAQEAAFKASQFENEFTLLVETPGIFSAWKELVQDLGIVGKQVHDARLVSVCHAHGITHLLTFNARHFARMAAYGPGLIVVSPEDV